MTLATTALAFALVVAQGRPDLVLKDAGADDLTAVRDLYAEASYEEALARLDKAEESLDAGQVEQYRALCLLGLGRSGDAQRSLERIVAGNPLYTLDDDDVSPRLVTMFHDVRRRLLPVVARDLYARAKTNYDAKNFVIASAQFRELSAILVDDDMKDQAISQGDLKMLAEGFLRLANAELVAAAKASAAAAPPVPSAPDAPPAPVVYSDADAGVVPPTDVQRKMPAWNPPPSLNRSMEYRGVLEIVINEQGAVESSTMRQAVTPFYDKALLQATTGWRFQPATRNGVPVRFRKSFQIVLSSAR